MRWLSLVVFCCAVLACAGTGEPQYLYCEPDTYCFVDVQRQCPPSSSAPAGSDDVADCVCHAGFYRVGDHCQECEADCYCPERDSNGREGKNYSQIR